MAIILNNPLPQIVRPKALKEFIGQQHIVGKDSSFRKLIDKGAIPSCIFWGPPGVGKTTLARLISSLILRPYVELSAVSSTVSDVRKVIKEGGILFLDEIHRFNKAQQDVLLPAVESGNVILIGATTENPSFSINSALLSRTRVLEFKPLSIEEIKFGLNRAINIISKKYNKKILFKEDEVLDEITLRASGDLRTALMILEDLMAVAHENNGAHIIDFETLSKHFSKPIIKYDRKGEEHYDHASAFQKSLRGSDPNAALYWMAKMLEGGEDPRFIARRLIVTSAEDVGLADPMALIVSESAYRALEHIGMPEGRLILSQAVIYVATAPKSNSVKVSIDSAISTIRKGEVYDVPFHLKDAHYYSAKDFGRGKEYVYPHERGSKRITYLPNPLKDKKFYIPVSKLEQNRIKKLNNYLAEHHLDKTFLDYVEKIKNIIKEKQPITVNKLNQITRINFEELNYILNYLHKIEKIQIDTIITIKD